MADKKTKVVGLRWEDAADEMPTVYANQFVISHVSGDEFYLVFGEAGPPMGMVRGESLESVPIRPVAKIAVSPGSMFRLEAAIKKNASQFRQAVQKAIDDAQEEEENAQEPE